MQWEVVYTEDAADWLVGMSDDDYEHMIAAIEMLEEHGPALGRPLVDHIKGSRHSNMKELRSGTNRALFIFDPIRRAVVLIGGDKRGDWDAWYDLNIPFADDLYDTYLKEEL